MTCIDVRPRSGASPVSPSSPASCDRASAASCPSARSCRRPCTPSWLGDTVPRPRSWACSASPARGHQGRPSAAAGAARTGSAALAGVDVSSCRCRWNALQVTMWIVGVRRVEGGTMKMEVGGCVEGSARLGVSGSRRQFARDTATPKFMGTSPRVHRHPLRNCTPACLSRRSRRSRSLRYACEVPLNSLPRVVLMPYRMVSVLSSSPASPSPSTTAIGGDHRRA
jgi:hypothetical protein